ncbi:hypothetical protein POM88_020193 [Heracleum sosnowskyi]|uniref:Amine oxidase domain-containing protein n=1 Tax=Heracleum sosnowskyi TaxID=360622 RepID=A0AAD8MSL2_9APIA|nr:hypothetical protein POM88_020193 [Heracleum sosnowskyi]
MTLLSPRKEGRKIIEVAPPKKHPMQSSDPDPVKSLQVISGGQIYEGDMALCAVPLGVLKSGSIKFTPELPQRKLEGIKRLGFGLLNKVAMLFPYVFWGTDLNTFGHLTDDQSSPGEFYNYATATVAGGPLLIALVAGEAE